MLINNISCDKQYTSNINNKNLEALNFKANTNHIKSMEGALSPLANACGDIPLIINRIKYIDIPIKDMAEYDKVFSRVCSARRSDGELMWLDKNRLRYYEKATGVEQGLLPYCGEHDSSFYINAFLSGRLTPENYELWKARLPEDKNSFVDMVRVLDFSLKNLDEEFGKYKGIVFRQGFMGENTGQYLSTSKKPGIAAQLNYNYYTFKPQNGFSVIRTNNGHKICDFQEKMGVEFSKSEEEILLSRQGEYKSLSADELDEELDSARKVFAGKLLWGADKVINGEIKEIDGYDIKKLLDLVKVFDEV